MEYNLRPSSYVAMDIYVHVKTASLLMYQYCIETQPHIYKINYTIIQVHGAYEDTWVQLDDTRTLNSYATTHLFGYHSDWDSFGRTSQAG